MTETTKEQNEQGEKIVGDSTGDWLGDSEARNFAVEGNELSGYIGVSPEYMTYADETHKPYSTDEEVLPPAEQLMFEESDESGEDSPDDQKAPKQEKAGTAPASATKVTSTAKAASTSAK